MQRGAYTQRREITRAWERELWPKFDQFRNYSSSRVAVARNKTCEPRKSASQRRCSAPSLRPSFVPFGIHPYWNSYRTNGRPDCLLYKATITNIATAVTCYNLHGYWRFLQQLAIGPKKEAPGT